MATSAPLFVIQQETPCTPQRHQSSDKTGNVNGISSKSHDDSRDPALLSPPPKTNRLRMNINLDGAACDVMDGIDSDGRMLSSENGHYDDCPPSPCATSTTTSPSVSRSLTHHHLPTKQVGANIFTKEHRHSRNSSQSLSIIPPSPSRSTLDPEYARRLFPNSHMGRQKQNQTFLFERNESGRESRQSSMFRTPQGSFSTMDKIDGHNNNSSTNMSGADTPNSSLTGFYTPERPSERVFIRNEASTNMSMDISSPPSKATPSQYYTPHSSPMRSTRKEHIFHMGSSAAMTPTERRKNKWSNGYYDGMNSITPSKDNRTTASSPLKYSDRFIPSRTSSNLKFSVWDDDDTLRRGQSNVTSDETSTSGAAMDADATTNDSDLASTTGGDSSSPSSSNQHFSQQTPILNALIRSELLGENTDPSMSSSNSTSGGGMGQRSNSPRRISSLRDSATNFLRFRTASRGTVLNEMYNSSSNLRNDPASIVNSFNLSPVGITSSNRLSSMPQKRKRRIAKVPFKVLDAPALADDFYLNLVDWSSQNVLAVGLGSCVYLWSACTSKVTKLCDLGTHNQDVVTSVAWTQRGVHLAVGVNNGEVQIWDTIKCKKIRTMGGHSARIGALSWSGPILASGSRDRLIYLRDVRLQQPFTARLAAHKQEVCGLKWSFDEPAHLASGGNDNKLLVWDIKNHRQPAHRFAEHSAAVKAIAWSPHQHGLLASGGGTADRCIRFWNALSGSSLNAVDTGSQVCNLAWSQNCNEIVSTHGYSLNQIAIWKYPTMQKVATLTGHTYRVLYLAMSPDGSTIVTGAGDETLRFWQVFPGPRSNGKTGGNGLLFPSSPGSILR